MNKNLNEQALVQLRNVFFFIIAAGLGFIFVIAPPYIKPAGEVVFYDAPLFPMIATAIKNFSIFPTTILLTIAGIIVGYLKPEIWWLLGLATVILFPIASISEMVLYPTTHNLWPLELLIYGIMSIPPIIGAFLGSKLRNRNRVQNSSAGA
jgi:hypothetical protein